MTEILSPSPWSSRQDSLRQNPPISYAELQAELARMEHVCDSYADENQRFFDEREDFKARGFAYRAMCAELYEALEPFNCLPKDYVPEWLQHKEGFREDLNFTVARATLTKARKLLEVDE